MAYGTHWEWRGFGGVSSRFADRFTQLRSHIHPHEVEDVYIWVPGLEVNIKFREGTEEGLKFKYPIKTEHHFELWKEDEQDLFGFPLTRDAWKQLSGVLERAGVKLPDYPSEAPTSDQLLTFLTDMGCTYMRVHKQRESRLWETDDAKVLVEWTSISEPQYCISIGLETWSDDPDADVTGQQALAQLQSAANKLRLEKEPLRLLSYLDAVKLWCNGNKI